MGVLGLVADLIASNRKLIDETLYRVRKMEISRESDRKVHGDG